MIKRQEVFSKEDVDITLKENRIKGNVLEKVECPNCGKMTSIDPDDHYEGEDQYECEHCQYVFVVMAETSIDYTPCGLAPCLNGGSHTWKQIVGAPRWHFIGRYRCETCNEEWLDPEKEEERHKAKKKEEAAAK